MRNAYAHGTPTVSASSVKRLKKAGITLAQEGAPVSLSYEELVRYRSRLLSLLRAGKVGK